MSLSIGVLEIALVLATAIVTVWVAMRTSRSWLNGNIAFAAVAMLTSPADPVSMLLIAVPCCTIYTAALLRMEKRLQTTV
jgi:Sec-independent protein secretion pathway component TatC